MKTARLSHRLLAEKIVRAVLADAEVLCANARTQRRLLRAAFAKTVIAAHVRYAAVRAVAGVSMLDLPDARQADLLDRGPRRRRTSRKKNADAAAAA